MGFKFKHCMPGSPSQNLPMEESFRCVLLIFALFSPTAANIHNILHLSPAFHLNILSSYNLTSAISVSLDAMFTVATPTLDQGGLFFPILSSPSFSTSASSVRPEISNFGYSLGFYLKPSQTFVDELRDPCQDGCNLYMAVCAGSLGSLDNSLPRLSLAGALMYGPNLFQPYKTVDGFAAPVWIANLDSPIRYADQASLMAQLVADSKGSTVLELQLRDGEKVLWRVRNANVMEMHDTGLLTLIYNSTNGSHLVWQSSPNSDLLVEGQSLGVGKELVSNDDSYVARMEKGGLVFYMNRTHFNRERQPTPYWVFPLYFPDAGSKSLNQLISSAPCSNSPARLAARHYDLKVSCSSNNSAFLTDSKPVPDGVFWVFWRLEGDGMLYIYTVSSSSGYPALITKNPLYFYNVALKRTWFAPLALSWQGCSVPMACGPLGVCTPGVETFCHCSPEPDFEPLNSINLLQGCKRSIDLPNCTVNGTGHSGSVDFVQLTSTASILLFNEWTFNSTPGADVNACKQSCSSDCSCHGFFYQINTSSCFFMSDEFSLMRVVDKNYTPIVPFDVATQSTIFAKDYITFLKVASGNKTKQSSSMPFETKQSRSRAALIALRAIIPSVVVCLLLGMVGGYLVRARRKMYAHTSSMLSKEESKELQHILPLLPNRFSYRELFEATQGFSKLLGAGGYGSVYAGVLSDGRKVAVKVLQVMLQGVGHSKQFLAEIATIGRTNHHNIVRLVGFCWEVSQRVLVYEYVERGSLDQWIFAKGSLVCDTSIAVVAAPFLDWKTRYNVAVGIARGLNYLHEECEQPILHFDIKPQNILLDNEFVAKLADFGMSRLIQRDMSTVVTGMRGTPGYIAPEWCTQGTVSKRSDIYSLGMVLLEIVGGRKNLDFSLLNSSVDPEVQEAWHFPTWAARKCEQGLMMEVVDGRLHGCGFDAAQALRLIYIAFWCIQENPVMRPNAPTVVQWLEGSSAVEQPPFSTVMNAGKHPNELEARSFGMTTTALTDRPFNFDL